MINVTRSSMPEFEEYCEEIKELWDSRWLTNMGAKHKIFENDLKKYLNTDNICLYCNGHLALENILAALDLRGEVITTPFTFASTTHAIVRNGLTPVFCDIDPDTYTIDVSKIEELITEKTSAIVPVHVYGNICDVEAIQKIADKYNLKVVYDAAHAFGVKYKGVSVANFGDASMFSFHATKVFHSIEGGMIAFKNFELYNKLNSLKNFGIVSQEDVEYIGGNAKMNEFSAAMGICNLRHLDDEIGKRKAVVERYTQRLENVEGIKICKINENIQSNYAYFPVVFDGYKLNRDEIWGKLSQNGITARKYFYPITNSFDCYQGLFDVSQTPVALDVSKKVVTLPLYADLKIEDIDKICDIILK